MSLQIATLREEHLEDAAALVSARYRALQERIPILPSRFENKDAILPLLRELASEQPGKVAIRQGRLVGFMTGLLIPEFLGKRSMYSPEWANGAILEDSRRIYEEMYAPLSALWVSEGCFQHLLTVLSNDQAGLEAWEWLGFGLVNVDAVRELEAVQGDAEEIEVRRASREESADATLLGEMLERHLAAPPIFWEHETQDYAQWSQEPTNALWLAYKEGGAIGIMGIGPANTDACDFIQDEQTASIVMAYTRESARGKGVATALLNRSLESARSQGYSLCAVDFEAMNVQARRFWMRWFQPVAYSLLRCINEKAIV